MYDDEDDRPVLLHARPPIADVTAHAVLDDTRPCPFCAETIRTAAIVCRFCRMDLRPQIAPAAPAYDAPVAAASTAVAPPSVPLHIPKNNTGGWLMLSLGVLCALAFYFYWTNREKPTIQDPSRSQNQSVPQRPVAATPRVKSAQERLDESSTLKEALEHLLFDDSTTTIDPGAARLALWGADHLRWSEVSGQQTSWSASMKDIDTARRRTGCFTGSVVEIQADRSGGETVWVGGLLDGGVNVVRFAAVKDSSGITEDSTATLCGVITGRQDYPNSIGGESHGLFVVGMFDTPANRATK